MKRWLSAALALACATALGQTTPPLPTERRGEVLQLAVTENFGVSEVLPIAVASIQPGSYVGTAVITRPDGTLQALEVLVFSEDARGSAEGHTVWDLQPGCTMTNATVSDLVVAAEDRTLKQRFGGGEKTVVVSESAPVATVKPADPSLLVAGAKVLATVQIRDGQPTALRAVVGRNGFAPPM